MTPRFGSFKLPALFHIGFTDDPDLVKYVYVNKAKSPEGYYVDIIPTKDVDIMNREIFISKESWESDYRNRVKNVTRNKNLTRKFITWIF